MLMPPLLVDWGQAQQRRLAVVGSHINCQLGVVAQLVEHRRCIPDVEGSSPFLSTGNDSPHVAPYVAHTVRAAAGIPWNT